MPAKRPKPIESKTYIEIDTKTLHETGELIPIGDPITAPTITTKVPRGKFEIIYTAHLFNILAKLGNRKIQVLNYLLDQRDANNTINATNVEIASAVNVSRPTVIETIKVLTEAGLVKRKGTVLMLNPNFVVKGNQIREAYLMQRFIEMDENKAVKRLQEPINAVIDPQLKFNAEGDIVEQVRMEDPNGKK
jgi:DNA-binding Lrp family transcriptional regulator